MKNCGRDDAKDLAEQIKGECIIIDKCKFYVHIGTAGAHVIYSNDHTIYQ